MPIRVLFLRLSGAARFFAGAGGTGGGVLQPGSARFIVPYEAIRRAHSPDETLLEFLQTTYDAAADLAQWDRASTGGAAIPIKDRGCPWNEIP